MTSPRKTLSLAMIVKNESRCLRRCLESIRPAVDEIIVVDTGSTDGTAEIARGCGARIGNFKWINDFAAARNAALEQTAGDWILVLDADEWAGTGLAAEIRHFIQGPAAIGRLKIVSDYRMNGQLLRSQTLVSRLFPRGTRFTGRIHEQIVSPLPRVNLESELLHDGYLDIQKSDRNLKILREELRTDPDNAYLLFQLAVEHTSLGDARSALPCLQRAFARMRPNDPFAPNIVVDYLYAMIATKELEPGLDVIAKSESALADFPDFHLVSGLFFMNLIRSDSARHLALLPRIEQSYARCLALGESNKYKSVRGAGTFLANYNLGVYHHVFGHADAARRCLELAAADGFEPAKTLLMRLHS